MSRRRKNLKKAKSNAGMTPSKVTDLTPSINAARAQARVLADNTNEALTHPVDFQLPTALNLIPPEQATSFLGPQQPIAPIAPKNIAGRAWDFPLGVNVQIDPRQTESVTFAELRALAEYGEIVRLCIETRKDQIKRLSWNIVPRDPKIKVDTKKAQIQAIETFFRYPDDLNDWSTWIGMLVEQLLVYDAPTIFPKRSLDGQLMALEIVDGATIKLIIDDRGRKPDPPYPAYQQVLHGIPAVNFTRDELIYRPRNPRVDRIYGFGPVEQIIRTINMAIRRQLYQLDYFTEGTDPQGFLETPQGWTQTQIEEFQKYYDMLMSGNMAHRRKIKFVPNGAKYTPLKEVILTDMFDEWLSRIICFCFSLPPTAFTKQTNRATAENQAEVAEEEGLAPLMLWIKNTMDFILERHMGIDDLIFQWQTDMVVSPLEQAQIDKIDVQQGIRSIDEVRQEKGLDPIGMGPAYFIATGIVGLDDFVEGKVHSVGSAEATDNATPDTPQIPDEHTPQASGTGPAGDRGEQTKAVTLDEIDHMLTKRIALIKPEPVKMPEPQPINLNIAIDNKPGPRTLITKRRDDGTVVTEEVKTRTITKKQDDGTIITEELGEGE